MKQIFLAFLTATIALTAYQLQPATAATDELFVLQACLPDGKVQARFDWRGNNPSAGQQWLDLSLANNGWEPGTFLGAGPFQGSVQQFVWSGLIPNSTHYVRVNQQVGGSWDPSPTFAVDTMNCASGSGGAGVSPTTEKVLAPVQYEGVTFERTGPGNYTAHVKVGLPNGCAKPGGYEINTALTIVRIQIYNEVPIGPVVCTQQFGTYDLTIDLPRNLTIGEWWRVDINRRIFGFVGE